MKNWLMITIAFLGCSIVNAEMPKESETLSSKVILANKNGYFVLSNQSCWKVIGFSKRSRSLYEWWNNIQLAPENYECVPDDWNLNSQIEVHRKYDYLAFPESHAENQIALKSCTHLLVNVETGQVLFAIAMEPSNALSDLFKEAHEQGHLFGYNKGYSEGYNRGYNIGYQCRG